MTSKVIGLNNLFLSWIWTSLVSINMLILRDICYSISSLIITKNLHLYPMLKVHVLARCEWSTRLKRWTTYFPQAICYPQPN